MRSWLAIWEAGVVIELPPWVLLLYLLSLLSHFNIDINGEPCQPDSPPQPQGSLGALPDIKFVATDSLECPTPKNSWPVKEGDEYGRGSLVYFNQATMYQTSETGHATIQEATQAGGSGVVDYGLSAQEAFTKYAKYIPAKLCTG